MDYFEYLGTFEPSDEVKSKANAWYGSGVEVIHVAAGGAGNSVMAAAEETEDAKVIGVDVDQAGQSDTVISSAMKALGVVVKEALGNYLNDTWVGGVTQNLGAVEDAIALPLGDSFKFDNFTLEQYEAILTILKGGELTIPTTEEEFTDYIEVIKPPVNLFPVKAVIDAAIGDEVTVVAKVVAITNHTTFYISDGVDAIAVYDGPEAFIETLSIGDVVEVVGTRGAFKGLNQIVPTTVTAVADAIMLDAQDLDGNTVVLTTDLVPLQGRYFTFTNVVISEVVEDQYNNLTFTFAVGDLTFSVRYDSRLVGSEDAATHLKTFAADDVVDLRLVLGWFNNAQFLYQAAGNIVHAD